MIARGLLALGSAAALAAPASPLAPTTDATVAKVLAASGCMAAPDSVSKTLRPVLVPGLTRAHLPVSGVSQAQAFFDQGMGQLFGFDFGEAERSFQHAAALDSACAMCSWGEALAIGPYVNSGPIDVPTIARAHALVAKALKGRLSDRDRALAEAALARYEPGGKDNGVHGELYADRMIALAARWPDDDLVAIMAAEAIMDAQPWDYWEAGGKVPKQRAGEALRLVDTVLARSPDDAQAIHLLIHLTEASANPERAAAAAGRLGALAPAAPHMVHMPAHTWYRLGRFDDAIAANTAAMAADTAYAKSVGADPQFYGYFIHHAHFLASSATQNGDRSTALQAADGLEASILPDAAAKKPYLQERLLTAMQARARFLTPAEVIALPAPDPRLTLVVLGWHGARAEAFAQIGNIAAAEAELRQLRKARQTLAAQISSAGGGERMSTELPFASVADAVARGRIAEARGRQAEALRQYRAAEAIEITMPYSEPPLWATPAAVLLGDLHLKQGDKAAAAADFRRALALRPGNALASAGLAAARGEAVAATSRLRPTTIAG
jgi:tetratricopeptide (TPR) repeat protein